MKKVLRRAGFFFGFLILGLYFFIIVIALEINKWLGKIVSLFKKKKTDGGPL